MRDQCQNCKHLRPLTGGCDAYPDGVPYRYSSDQEVHDTIQKDQEGKAVLEPGEPEQLKALAAKKRR